MALIKEEIEKCTHSILGRIIIEKTFSMETKMELSKKISTIFKIIIEVENNLQNNHFISKEQTEKNFLSICKTMTEIQDLIMFFRSKDDLEKKSKEEIISEFTKIDCALLVFLRKLADNSTNQTKQKTD